jgi:hypothetical protein
LNLSSLIQKAASSKFQLWKLNRILWIGIPFNKPHRFKIIEIRKGFAKISIPYRKNNLNHIKTIHACAMATCAEYTSGLVIGGFFDFKDYRLIMKEINVEYHYQGKMDSFCIFNFGGEQYKEVTKALTKEDSHDLLAEIRIMDIENNHLATAKVLWQIKEWSKTKKSQSK